MSKKQIDIYRTGIYLRLSQGDEDIDGLEKKESAGAQERGQEYPDAICAFT